MSNAPFFREHIVLEEHEKKVDFQKDTKSTNTGSFIILKEDHTLGNMVRMSLLRDPEVLFAGYRMPHPLENRLVVRVRTRDTSNPIAATRKALTHLKDEMVSLEEQLKRGIDQIRSNDQFNQNQLDFEY